jgi:serine/threonine protein kinase
MNAQLEKQIQEIIGKISKTAVLDEQGCTSEVRKIITDDGIYLLKSSYEDRYQEWLKAEALVLEKLNSIDQIKIPKYYGFIEANDISHLIMSFENGITLTSALKKARNTLEIKLLIRSFGQFLNELHETKIIESLNHEYDWLDEQLVRAETYVNAGQT